MKITITNRLTKTEENQVRQLIASIRKHDHLTREPFLTNILNADQDMPAFLWVMILNHRTVLKI